MSCIICFDNISTQEISCSTCTCCLHFKCFDKLCMYNKKKPACPQCRSEYIANYNYISTNMEKDSVIRFIDKFGKSSCRYFHSFVLTEYSTYISIICLDCAVSTIMAKKN